MILLNHSGQNVSRCLYAISLLNHVKPHINCVILSCIFLFLVPPRSDAKGAPAKYASATSDEKRAEEAQGPMQTLQ